MRVGIMADAENRNSDKHPAVNRLADLKSAGGLALCCERRTTPFSLARQEGHQMNAEARWLHQEFFVLGDERNNFTRAVRDELKESLGLDLKIRGYPSRQGLWQHTTWWHEGCPNYSEAQFCARISKEYPVLSLGLSVEKGLEGAADPEDEMDRDFWDWPRFVRDTEEILSGDVPRVSVKRISLPTNQCLERGCRNARLLLVRGSMV